MCSGEMNISEIYEYIRKRDVGEYGIGRRRRGRPQTRFVDLVKDDKIVKDGGVKEEGGGQEIG